MFKGYINPIDLCRALWGGSWCFHFLPLFSILKFLVEFSPLSFVVCKEETIKKAWWFSSFSPYQAAAYAANSLVPERTKKKPLGKLWGPLLSSSFELWVTMTPAPTLDQTFNCCEALGFVLILLRAGVYLGRCFGFCLFVCCFFFSCLWFFCFTLLK